VTDGRVHCITQMEIIDDEDAAEGCVLQTGNLDCETGGRSGQRYCCPAPAGAAPASAPEGTAEGPVEKQTWWSGDVTGMVDSFFNKLGIGDQASEQAENTARVEGAVATASVVPSPEPPGPAAPGAAVQSTTTTSPRPWYVQYAPHMVIGGLGLGAVITLVLVMRKR